ncbi:MAG: hypothetical protein JWP61_549 [Friedmanniella sp.]|nr:hypothetical protein [Friedmanniella sp.]
MTEPVEEIDVRNNPESKAAASSIPSPVARASDGGPEPRDAPAAGELPAPTSGGTADGNPVAGLEISAEDAEDAVVAKDAPLEPGQEGPYIAPTSS